jgi:hypothetical protein
MKVDWTANVIGLLVRHSNLTELRRVGRVFEGHQLTRA